jgi:hypothetical protein
MLSIFRSANLNIELTVPGRFSTVPTGSAAVFAAPWNKSPKTVGDSSRHDRRVVCLLQLGQRADLDDTRFQHPGTDGPKDIEIGVDDVDVVVSVVADLLSHMKVRPLLEIWR